MVYHESGGLSLVPGTAGAHLVQLDLSPRFSNKTQDAQHLVESYKRCCFVAWAQLLNAHKWGTQVGQGTLDMLTFWTTQSTKLRLFPFMVCY